MRIDEKKLPEHIAIIMDGNGRWARKRRLPNIVGHRKGISSVEEIIKASSDIGIKALTLYAFSTENWKRPKREVGALMRLLENYLDKETERLVKENVKLRALGRINGLPTPIQNKIKIAEKRTEKNTGLLLNLALNYGSRTEIVDACRAISGKVKENSLKIKDIDEKLFSKHLYTTGIPDPDLLIRTSGEMRISNFLLWQMSYAEIYVTDTLWPDFKRKDLEKAIEDFVSRERRYGG